MRRTLRRFNNDRSGVTALEFALVAPLFFGLVFSTFEAGWMMTKATMLDRALDITVRLMRIGADGSPTTQAAIKQEICKHTLVISGCVDAITVELIEIKLASDFPTKGATCVDRGSNVTPAVTFAQNNRSSVMYVRTCIITQPLTPLLGVALHLPKDSLGGYSIVSSSAFMNEPGAMRARIRDALVHLRREQGGVAAIEFAIIAPVVAALLLGCVTLFLLFRGSENAEKATFTVADIVSRQTTVTNAFLANSYTLFVKMLSDENAATRFRISSLKKISGKITVDWSYPVSPMKALTIAEIPTAKLPLIADNDSVILIETSVFYEPLFGSVGLPDGIYANISANRPRFTSAIAKTD